MHDASNILTKIIHKSVEEKINDNLKEDQFGFRKNRVPRDAILCLRMIKGKMYCSNKPIYYSVIEKALKKLSIT